MSHNREKSSSLSRSLLTALLTILSVLLIVGLVFLANHVIVLQKEINSIKSLLSNTRAHEATSIHEDNYYSSYIKLSEKADQEMERLVSTVGILATVYTIFGALIVFKAPHEIDKRIEKIDSLISDVKDSAIEATYQAAIIEAVVNDYNGKPTNYDKLCRLSKVIDKYPDRPDAYMQRGFVYDNMGRYDDAITDYKIGLKNGANKSSYYNAVAIAYNKKRNYKKAISFYTKAIELDNDDASQYANRGSCYDDMHEYEKALVDYHKAIEIDDGCKEAYINRSITLKKQLEYEGDENKKNVLYGTIIDDLKKALELDPDDVKTRSLLRNSINPNFNPDKMIAIIDEKIGDLECENKNYFSALKLYIESCNYYILQQSQDNKDYLDEIERIVLKVFAIDTNEVASELSRISKELSLFCQGLREISILFYVKGKKETAEKAFIILSIFDDNKENLLNLLFMKRRNETKILKTTASELLAQYDKPENAIWCTNKALCYVSGVDNFEINWQKAIEAMNGSSENIDAAVSWWKKISIVGAPENNVAMILFGLSKKFSVEDDVPLSQRIATARADGYVIPADIIAKEE